jgi:uncharacterized membrane protein YoaK (UPF0700 family)
MLSHSGGFFKEFNFMKGLIKKIGKTVGEGKKGRINKGGRPKLAHKKSEALSVMCNLLEKKIIQANARNVGKTVSVFLRDLGLHNRSVIKVRTLPRSVLQLTGTLNHIAANINQLAKKHNQGNDLNGMERALLNQEIRSLQTLVKDIKNSIS